LLLSDSERSKISFPKPLSNASESESDMEFDYALYNFLRNFRFSVKDAKHFVVGVCIRNFIFSSLHSFFFEGRNFYGVGSKSLQEYLERMMSILESKGTPNFFSTHPHTSHRHTLY
jgi:hypothetical protein